ncbi:protein disulfide isomerase-like 1-1 [Spinacia oleracea]|uniref:Protein disulfide-isomerase n=1 Tax=Spinacia oleracea TaxID=3562 RepID=A0A9R0J9L4_SPIOL|nr:protein disulfide isomerase-like 1-1 [Spinacia oleracea]
MALKIGGLLEVCLVVVLLATIGGIQVEAEKEEYVITLDHSNFTDVVSKHDFILVEFYAPWCGYCKQLAPEYEKAAATLSKHDPPITLAKVDLNEDTNKEHFKSQFEIRAFPTLKFLINGGKIVHDYKNPPQSADDIVQQVKKLLGPVSAEIKSVNDASKIIDQKKVFIAGVFPKFEGEEYGNFIKLAEKLRSDYEFGHTLDAKVLPRGDSSVKGPVVRLLKPFDDLFADTKDFDLAALEKFVQEEDVPSVIPFTMDPSNTYLRKAFSGENTKIMMVLDFKSENAAALKSRFSDAAILLKGDNKYFLVGDLESSKDLLKHFKLEDSHAPLVFIHKTEAQKYLKTNVEPDQLAPWLKKFLDGKLEPFLRLQPIPEENNEPVKVVVLDSLQDMVFNSEKEVFLEFYAPWCGHCKSLAPILDEVAISYEKDANIMIAKFDASANDAPKDTFNVKGFPTMFFITKSKEIVEYNGGRAKEDIVGFIEKHRTTEKNKSEAGIKSEPEKENNHVDETVASKDEL